MTASPLWRARGGRATRGGASTTATFRYLTPLAERPYVHCYEPPPGVARSNYRWDERALAVEDIRPAATQLSWDTDGLRLVRHAAPPVELGDHAAARALWYGMACDLVRQATGASTAIVFDHTFRKTITASESTADCRPPVMQVHVDGVADIAAGFVRRHYPAEAEGWLAGHWQIINLWRPLLGRVEDMPLAFCDGRNICVEDLVATDLLFPEGRTALTYQLTWRADHRWRYFPDMTATEAVMFKCFDSAETAPVRFVPHCSFADAGCRPDAPPRRSVELRLFVHFGD